MRHGVHPDLEVSVGGQRRELCRRHRAVVLSRCAMSRLGCLQQFERLCVGRAPRCRTMTVSRASRPGSVSGTSQRGNVERRRTATPIQLARAAVPASESRSHQNGVPDSLASRTAEHRRMGARLADDRAPPPAHRQAGVVEGQRHQSCSRSCRHATARSPRAAAPRCRATSPARAPRAAYGSRT